MNKEQLLSGFFGRIFTGSFTKVDGTRRPVWGVIKKAPDISDNLVVVYDFRKKQYRRFRIDLPFNIKSGKDFIAASGEIKT
jgi:hypothetical protein